MFENSDFMTVEQAIDWYEWDKHDLLENINNQIVKIFESEPDTLMDQLAFLKLMVDIEREYSVSL